MSARFRIVHGFSGEVITVIEEADLPGETEAQRWIHGRLAPARKDSDRRYRLERLRGETWKNVSVKNPELDFTEDGWGTLVKLSVLQIYAGQWYSLVKRADGTAFRHQGRSETHISDWFATEAEAIAFRDNVLDQLRAAG